MKKNAFWFVILLAALFGVVNYTSKVQAQQSSRVRVDVVVPNLPTSNSVQVSGRIIGFSCVQYGEHQAQCFVASTD